MTDSARKKLEASRKKAQELKEIAQDFIAARKEIPTGEKMRGEIEKRKRLVMEILGASDADWESWHWQMQNRIGSAETLGKILDLNEANRKDIEIENIQQSLAVIDLLGDFRQLRIRGFRRHPGDLCILLATSV
ncbi:MAG: hypothetical protein ACP5G4_03210 [bacterium]